MPLDVLIVDDSAPIRKVLQRVLLQTELPIGEMVEAGDGIEALAALETRSFGLVISDINMPNMDGIQLLTRIKQMEAMKTVPIVMISTECGLGRFEEAVQLGAAGYVPKPFTPRQIKEKLGSLLDSLS